MSLEEHFPDHQLQERGSVVEDDSSTATSHLHPTDGGWAAWLFLLGCFMIEMLLWGFPFSFGVMQDYYANHQPISLHPAGVSTIGTTCTGIMYLAAPFLFAVFERWPQICRKSTSFGLAIVIVAIAISSFATSVWQLILTQGVLYAIGGGFLYYPVFIFIDEWFVQRKSFAFGVMWAGSGCGGLSGPLVMNWGLSRYGHQRFLRGWAIALVSFFDKTKSGPKLIYEWLILIGPFLHFVKPRLPISRTRQAPRVSFKVGFGFIRTGTFWALQIGNIVQGLGYFIPALYLPGYARTLGYSGMTGSLMVSLLNTASVPGVVLLSALCDRTTVTNVIFISAFGSTVSVFLFWGFSTSLPVMILFAIMYGFFAGGYTSTYAGTVKELKRVSTGSDLGSMFGLLSVGRGIGNVICGPISESLLGQYSWHDKTLFAYGSAYGPLIAFTGITAALTLTPWVTKMLHLI